MDDTTLAAVLAVHTNFYTALSLADLALMQRLWLASPDAVCLHPGWATLHGWDAILESWRGIFENQGVVRIWPTNVQVRLYGHTAEINCVENVDLTGVRGSGIAQTRATNILRQVARDWKFLEHHAVSLPLGQAAPRDPFSTN
jgi:ketosteroid isomerase-like protein